MLLVVHVLVHPKGCEFRETGVLQGLHLGLCCCQLRCGGGFLTGLDLGLLTGYRRFALLLVLALLFQTCTFFVLKALGLGNTCVYLLGVHP